MSAVDPEARVSPRPSGAAGRDRTADASSTAPCVQRMIAAHAAAAPDAAAVVCERSSLGYGELARRAARLAARLRRCGVGPDVRVGICMERSPEMVVALLGVLEAGAAFLALDPAYPADRLRTMVVDSGVRLLLTDGARSASPPWADGLDVLRVDDDRTAAAAGGAERLGVGNEARPEQLAYVIYTSGSTGRPKGVGVTHRGLRNTVRSFGRLLHVRAGSRFLQFASASFDASVCEIFVALAAGAELHLAPRDALRPGPELVELLERRRITHVILPPSTLAVLPAAELPALSTLIVAGEACPPDLVRRWSGGRRFVNAYGPTEAAICATAGTCEPDGRTPPIGAAIDGASAHVLDGELAPAGEGELYVGGEGVARGYLGRPALTAERFVPDPFAAEPGARMYRTGDRVRVRPDGSLEFTGRMDDQVKVRGHRVEPGEVEHALASHPALAHAVVVARDDAAGGVRLVAYAVPRDGAARPAAAGLRAFLEDGLPGYMIPSAFVVVDALPLTPNGKVDRRALPDPDAERPALAPAYAEPRTPAERRVAAVWAQVLGVERVGAGDGFFELGGHSLAATQVVSRLREEHGVEVPLDAVLRGGTVAEVARTAEAGGAGPPAFNAIRPVADHDGVPPSFAQERVWFLIQLAPDNLSYHAHAALVLRGELDVAALERALSAVVARHEILRTTFPTAGGRPAQRIHEPWEVRLPVVDLSDVPETAREEAVRGWMREHFAQRFDLARLPLVRWTLLRTGPAEHRLVHVEHHIIHDGWSFNVLLRELVEAYRAAVDGGAPELGRAELQYADFCAWQREWMESPAARAQLDFWRGALAGSPPELELPTDRPRPAVQRFRGAAPRFHLPGELYRRLRALAHGEDATLFMAMLAGFCTVLARWSGQEDVSVGTGIAMRRQRETEEMLGMFVNSLVLRTDLSGDPTFRDLLARVRRTTLAAYQHQDVPFEAVVDAVRPGRQPGRNPLFQVMFSFHDSAEPELALPGLETELQVALSNRSAKFDLNVVAMPHAEQRAGRRRDGADGITLVWEHDSDLFDLATMERMFRHYRRVLEAAVAEPDTPVSRLAMLAPDEARALVAAGRATRAVPVAECLHERFERRAAERPDDVAVTFGAESLSYAELNARANRLAHRLRAMGVGPETRVGLCLERSAELVVAILAVLKAGGGYVPIDPAYPAARVALVLEDAGVPVLVTTSELRPRLPGFSGTTLCLDDAAEALAGERPDDPGVEVGPDALAYVIYTSGSTGTPKGVQVTHANVVRLFDATEPWFGFGADDVWTLFHSYAFDFSVWEIWGALLHGGRLVVVPFLTSRSPADFRRLLAEQRVTVLNQTPSAFRQLARADEEEGARGGAPPLSLRLVVFGGEALDPRSLAPWIERHGDARPRLVNMYGITETTVHVTYRPVTRADLDRPASPIGVPIPDLSLHVLDRHLRPVPAGVAGELYVGGAGVARGYLNRPELTARRFVPDPFSDDPRARLYRSGDLARRRADGELEYLGRADQQVKVRGFRIEPGEIEAALRTHPDVAHAAVAARRDGGAENRLVAYVVPVDGADAPGAAELRSFLSTSLPDHMVPAAFVALDALPLTPHGKLDRAALPAPGTVESGNAYEAPRTPTETALARVWREVLDVERPGIDDNYFVLGGDSIRAVRVVALARERGLEVTLPQLFEFQSIRLLARAAAGADGRPEVGDAGPRTAPFALVPDEVRRGLPPTVEDAYPLTQLQTGMLYHSELDPGSTRYHNVSGYRLETAWDEDALRRAVRRLSRRHAVLRTSFDLAARPEPLQLVHADAEVPLAVHDLRSLAPHEQESELDALVRTERARRFDWRTAPLVRMHAHRLSDHVFRFTLVEHHAVLDGWSTASLLTELFRDYAALRDGRDGPAPEAPRTAFRDYVALERAALASAESRDWWARALDGVETTRLPRPDGMRADGAAGDAASRAVELDAEESAALRRLAERAGVPLKSVLLAAHLRVLALLAGRRRVLTGLVTHGRPETADGERVLGLFLNTVPLVARVEEGSWIELARAAFAAEREMLPHRRFPLAEAQRTAGRAPLVDIAFNYIHFHVLDDLLGADDVGFQGAQFLQETEFSLVTNFYTDVDTGRVRFRLDYDASALDAGQAAALAARYRRVLDAMAGAPEAPHEATGLLSDDERATLLEWGTGAEVEAGAPTPAALFDRQAGRAPDAEALSAGGERIGYAELRDRAERLARRLRAAGAGRGTVVGVCTGRSAELVVAMLAVLKSGGVYLPLDPAYPPERLALLLEDSGAGLVVATAATAGRLPAGAPRVLADASEDDPRAAGAALPAPAPTDDAYVVYTSGSTGRPKGVAVRHREAAAHCAAAVDAWGLTPADAVLAFASAGFDVSLEQILPPLAAGARIVLRGDEVPAPAELASLVRREGVTVVNLPTGYWAQVISDAEARDALRATRLVIAGGDVMHPADIRAWSATEGPARLVNAYGPTEALVTAAAYRVPDGFRSERVPVGRPFPGRRLYVTGESGELLPAGVAGELRIGGALLARGYLARGAATAERFVPDPFAAGDARAYRTGDRARWRADGTLEFLGREDGQVKLRGFRVELGEVEAVLRAHPAVREAAAAVRTTAAGRLLAAYAVPRDGAAPDAAALRAFLAARLPAHAVPAALVTVDSLPLTPNGKLDRAALPAPEPPAGETAHVAPRTQVEALLCTAWAEALGVPRVGIDDDFFALGGHSLVATRLVARIRALFHVALPLRALFDAPTVAGLAARVEDALRDGDAPPPPPAPRSDAGPAPLSFAQRRLWFLDRMEPGRSQYNLPSVVRLRGPLDVAALERAVARLVERHEALRTVLRDDGRGDPVQVVRDGDGIRLDVVDLRDLPPGRAEAEAAAAVREEIRRPFDLAAGPLFRARLVRVDDEHHLLAVTLHHTVGDAASLRILFRELSALYAAAAHGADAALPAPALRYRDYARWQREWLTGERVAGQTAWWRDALAGAPPALELPTDRPRPAAQSERGAAHAFSLDEETGAAVRELARCGGATPFMTLLAAFQALLSRWSGQDDVVVGTPVTGRAHPETEETVGLFVNTLPVRAALSDDPSFRALLGRVRDSVLGALAHQDVPFEKLVEELRPERSLGRQPIFQAVFALNHGAAADVLELEGTSAEPVLPDAGTSKFDLTLFVTERAGALSGVFEYAADLFDAATMERMAEQLHRLLAAAAADPDAPVSALLPVGGEERARLEEWERGPAGDPGASPVHRHFEAAAARTPDAVAVSCAGERLTYAALDARANRLARHLRAVGVRTETRVGVASGRSAELPVALLAILKAGGAYVPLDPAYPAERLAFLLEDAGVEALVVADDVPDALASFGGPVVSLAGDRDRIAARDPGPLRDVEVDAAQLAYVVYTSGSTGVPKGVGVPHRAVVRLVRGADYARFADDEVFLHLAPLGFDASTFEVWGALLNGGRLAVFPPGLPSVGALSRTLEEEGVTTLWLTAGLFHQVADAAPGAFRGVRRLLAGGDVLSPEHVRRVLDAVPGLTVIDGYGPTEATTFTTCHAMHAAAEVDDPVPLGTPIEGAVVRVLDGALRRVPVGVPGELCIGGSGLARGYLGRSAPTAEAFVPDPFSRAPGARLYRSGDRVRWRADRTLEFLGRLDAQVKVRGFRVEPGEVEAALSSHPGVGAAAVVVDGDGSDRRLLAFFAPAADAAPDARDVRDWLRARLPSHLLPAGVQAVDALPLTTNGKVDRSALASSWTGGADGSDAPPEGEVEEALAELFRQVLGAERIGAHDDFFELGGHSLLAIRTTARLTEIFRFEVPVRLVFEAPTVAALAAGLEAREPRAGHVRTVARLMARLRSMDADQVRTALGGEGGGPASEPPASGAAAVPVDPSGAAPDGADAPRA